MPKAAPAAGTGTPVSGDHSHAQDLNAPVVDEYTNSHEDHEDLGSHQQDEVETDEETSDEEVTPEKVPTRLKGKSLAQVYDEFSGLEQAYSRQGNELGEARKLLQMRLQADLQQSGAKPAASDEQDVTDEDFDANPREAASRLVKKETKSLEDRVTTAEQRAMQIEFNARHPNYIQTAQSPEFQEWVSGSKFRQRMFSSAAAFDMDAAEELYTEWEAHTAASQAASGDDADGEGQPASRPDKHATIRRQRTATGGAGRSGAGKSGKKVYSSLELMKLYNTNREAYNAMEPEIRQAFAEGRVR